MKHPKQMSEDKDQGIELFIKDVESGSKLVDSIEIKDEEEGIELGILEELEASKEDVRTQVSSK